MREGRNEKEGWRERKVGFINEMILNYEMQPFDLCLHLSPLALALSYLHGLDFAPELLLLLPKGVHGLEGVSVVHEV